MPNYCGSDVSHVIRMIKEKIDNAGKQLKEIYFVACGGSEAALAAGHYLMDCEAKTIGAKKYNSNVFVHATPKKLDDECIVVACSLKGTAETIVAMKKAQEHGAHTICLTAGADTPIAQSADTVVIYGSHGQEGVYDQSSTAYSLRIAFEVLHQFENYDRYEMAIEGFSSINKIVASARVSFKEQAVIFANKFKDDEIFYVLGCGPLLGTAYSMAFCHLNEMQTRHAVLIPSGDYFHGPFETTTDQLPIVLLKSGGRTRPMDQRVEDFLSKHGGRQTIIDAKDTLLWQEVDPSVAEFFEPAVIWDVERMFVETLADRRRHPMTDRVYMWKFPY